MKGLHGQQEKLNDLNGAVLYVDSYRGIVRGWVLPCSVVNSNTVLLAGLGVLLAGGYVKGY